VSQCTSTKNLEEILEAIKNAQAPEKLNSRFLTDLGFLSTNDRLIIGVFKALGLIDEIGEPTERYFEYLDESQSEKILGQGLREAYGDLFRINDKAHEMNQQYVKQKLKTLTRGTKSDAVLNKMAMTFTSLCKLADFSTVKPTLKIEKKEPSVKPTKPKIVEKPEEMGKIYGPVPLAYNIQIQLPSTRDQAVYDAIFSSLKEHIL